MHLISSPYRKDIDGLRAIAVLSVLAFHAFPNSLGGGFVGVDVFFVISGFLISRIITAEIDHGRFGFLHFYARRIRRIFPALALVLAACLAAGWFLLLPTEFKQLGLHTAGGAAFISNFISLSESGYFDTASEQKPLLHLWSLGIEEQFYIAWPLVLWLTWRRWRSAWPLCLLMAASFCWNLVQVRHNPGAAFYSPQTRVWELLVGALIAAAATTSTGKAGQSAPAGMARKSPWAAVSSAAGLAMIALAVFITPKNHGFPGWWALLPTLGAALLIGAGENGWANRHVLSHGVLVWFGKISYPLYLWHWPMLAFLRIAHGDTPPAGAKWLALAAAVVAAALTHRLVETPCRFGRRPRLTTAALSAAVGLLGLAGYWVHHNGGLASRYPPIVQELTQFSYDWGADFSDASCFLAPEQGPARLDQCEPLGGPNDMVLWGDSHAAHLLEGYRSVYGGKARVLQRAASGCPPILGIVISDRPHCTQINARIFEALKQNKPHRLVLAAKWPHYDLGGLESTIAQLHQAGIDEIDLVGPVPLWQETLPKQLYKYYAADPLHRIPDRMSFGLNPAFMAADDQLAALSAKAGVRYLSPRKFLCNSEGCITRFGATSDTLSAWDYGHLTKVASRILVRSFHTVDIP